MKLIISENQYNLLLQLQTNMLSESKVMPFTLNTNNKGLYTYNFTYEDKNMVVEIYPNPWQKNYYDVVFGVQGGKTTDRVSKSFDFMNTVLKTVFDCIKDFISRKDNVKIIAFQADDLRERAYVRFIKNHPFFSKFELTKNGIWNEIHINKVNNIS